MLFIVKGNDWKEKGMTEKEPEKLNTEPNEEKVPIVPDPAIEKMTKEEALEYFDLPAWARREDIDDRFWKLGKTYKAQNDEQKLADLSAAYNVATGNRDRIVKEKEEEAAAKHYLGKTKKQWGDFFHYEGWKIIIGVAVLVFVVTFVRFFFLATKLDIRVTGIGHFELDADILIDVTTEHSSFKTPEVQYVDVVSDNNEGEEIDVYALQQEVALMAVRPSILIYDAYTVPSYVSSETLLPLDDLYEEMKNTWTEEELSHVQPYIYSQARFVEEYGEKVAASGVELPEITEESKVEHVYGFIISDKIDQLSLGVKVLWKESDTSIVLGINAGGEKLDESKEFIKNALKDMKAIREDYLKQYPYVESKD